MPDAPGSFAAAFSASSLATAQAKPMNFGSPFSVMWMWCTGSVPRMYSAVGVRATRTMPNAVRNSSWASRSGERSRPYARSRTFIPP